MDLRRRYSLDNWEKENYFCAFIGAARYLYPSAMNLHNILNDSKAKTAQPLIPVGAKERFAYPFQYLRRNARTIVFYSYSYGVILN